MMKSRRAGYESFDGSHDLVGTFLGGDIAVPNIPQSPPTFAYQNQGLHALLMLSIRFEYYVLLMLYLLIINFKSNVESYDSYFVLGIGFQRLMRPDEFTV
jgi:hypothetical protein